ncbi:MAG: hypothetical protein GY806_18510 [Gammaproteobacteria bacterium]|nr:hypothetical protein [Gammaproteobacteria bacterium]
MSNINGRSWLMQLRQCQVPNHLPHVLSVIGRKADPYIKQSSGILEWYQLINEIQMYMHSHQVNQKRLQQGMATINSLWCWGGGELTAVSNSEVKVFCDDFLTSAFLARIGLVPENLQGITDGIFAQNNICIDLSLLRALKAAQSDDLQAVIESIESTIFEPLLNAVGSGRLKIRLRTGHDFDYLLNRFSLLKFWQKPVNLATVIE